MHPAVENAKKMTGILMGTETVDQVGKSLILVIPDVSVYDPKKSDSLISLAAERLMQAGYRMNFGIPLHTVTGSLVYKTIPDNLNVIVFVYAGYTWCLPKAQNLIKQSLLI